MVISPLTKKTLRTLYRSRGQVLAVAAVVLCGTACYIALSSCHRNLLLTRDSYYAENRFADFEITLQRAPETALFKIQEIPGVRQVRARIVEEVKLELPGDAEAKTGRIVSMPDERRSVINNVVVTQGRYFEPGAVNETIMSERFAEANGLSIGESIYATIDGRKHTLKIVGLGASPEYIYIIRSMTSLVPEPDRFAILWVPEKFAEDAKNMQAACNNIIGTLDDPAAAERVLDAAADILSAYGVYAKTSREHQISNRFISDEITGLGVQARVLPTVFLGVAALVIFIVLNRMVRNERTQIGLLKAYGHSNMTIALHYVQYALFQSLLGAIGGFVVGQWMAAGMIRLYVRFYTFPILRARMYPDVLFESLGIAIVFSLLGAVIAAYRAARIHPAESMRPGAPRRGKRTIFERYPAMWRRLSFTWKMIVRNVSRNPFRTGLNVFGVMMSAAQLIVGFYAIDAITYILDFQYKMTQSQDATVSFFFERGKDALRETERLPFVREAEPLLQYPFEMKNGWRKKDAVVIGMPQNADLQRLLDTKNRAVDIGDQGLVLSSALAKSLRVKVGDEVQLKPLMGRVTKEKRVKVSRVVEQYFGMSGYMNIDALSRLLDEPYAMNAVLVRTDRGAASRLHDEVKNIPMIGSVELRAEALQNLQNTLAASMRIMGTASIIFAAVIAFSIIYNVTMVSLGERERELASLRVLGFTQREVGAILFNENFLTGALGIMLGIPMGMAMVWGMMHAFDMELFRFPFHIEPRTYAISAGLTTFFIVFANLAVRWKIRRLDMVETLKARD